MGTALIFDLDSCLSAADEVGRGLFEPAFDRIRRANAGDVSDEDLADAFDECWRFPFDDVARRYAFSRAMRDAGFEAFATIEVGTPMQGYGDLEVLGELPKPRFLVTTGFRRLQESKVRALGIGSLFDEVHVDAIDEPDVRGKAAIFGEIIGRRALDPRNVVVVGDNPDSEIAAGNQLGCVTVQILRPGVARGGKPSHVVGGLAELRALLAC